MAIKSDKWIKKMSLESGMITPFSQDQVSREVISYGVSSYGYDLRVADEYKIFTNINNSNVDPKNFDDKSFVRYKGDVCIVPANSFALARSVEYFKIPKNIGSNLRAKTDIYKSDNFVKWLPNWKYMKTSNDEI